MSNFICGKYIASGPNAESIGLPVVIPELPEEVTIEGVTMKQKHEFHITLVATGEIMKKHQTPLGFAEGVKQDFCEFVKGSPIEFLRFKNEVRFVDDGEVQTLVVMCEVSHLDEFFLLLNEKYGLSLECPPTHVTLYTTKGLGVYLTDADDLVKMTKVVESPVGEL